MSEELELHDSDISSINESGDRLTVTFSEAYIWSYGEGWGQKAIFSLGNFEITSRPAKLPLRISEGKLYGEANEFNNTLEVPLSLTGKFRFELLFTNGEMFKVSGVDPIIELIGERRFIENTPKT